MAGRTGDNLGALMGDQSMPDSSTTGHDEGLAGVLDVCLWRKNFPPGNSRVPNLVNNTEVVSMSSFSFLDLGKVVGLSESDDCDSSEVGCELEELDAAWGCGVLKFCVPGGLRGV